MIARFGRALNFARPNPIPIWSRGDANVFPSGIGWADFVPSVSAPVVPTITYGEPFLDTIAFISTTLGFESHVNPFITMRSRITPFIERLSKIASTFISRSSK